MMNSAMEKETGHCLMIDSAPETSGALCILCLSQHIRDEDTNLSMQKLSSFKSMAESLGPDLISMHKRKSGEQCKYLLERLTEKHSDQDSQPDRKQSAHSEEDNLNICINCMNAAEQQLQKVIKHRQSYQEERKPFFLNPNERLPKSRSAHSKFIFNHKKSFLAHDDESNSESENISGNSHYLSKIAYGNSAQEITSKIKNTLNQEDQITNAHSENKTSPKLTFHEEKKQYFMKETLALESNEEPQLKSRLNFKKAKPLEKLIIQGFPTKQMKKPNNIHKSIQTFVEKVKVKIEIPRVEEVCCKYCEYQLEKCCAIQSRLQKKSWVCRTCFTLNEEQMKLLSFDRKRNDDNNEVSRKKRAQTLNKAQRPDRQSIQFLPFARNGRVSSYNLVGKRENEAVSECFVCEKKGVTLVKEKGKSYCIYCYYNHRKN